MKLVSTRVLRAVLACSLGFAGLGAAQSTTASPPWGTAEVREITRFKNCTVYGLVTDPDHTFWVICSSDADPLPSAETGH